MNNIFGLTPTCLTRDSKLTSTQKPFWSHGSAIHLKSMIWICCKVAIDNEVDISTINIKHDVVLIQQKISQEEQDFLKIFTSLDSP